MNYEKETISYRELRDILNNQMNETQLDQTVTIYLNPEDEFAPVSSVLVCCDSEDRLDAGSVYLSV